MPQPFDISLPPDIALWDGCRVRVTALNPLTGDTVTGVTVSDVSLQVVQVAGEPDDLTVGMWRYVPGPGA